MKKSTRLDLVLFGILTVLITGGLWLVLMAAQLDIRDGAGLWIFGLATSGPSLAALVLFIFRSRRSSGTQKQPVAAPWIWLPAALILGAAPTVLANLIVNPDNVTTIFDRMPETFAQFGGGLMFVVLFLIAGPIAEEFGWRGYAQPRIRQRLGVLGTSVALGLAWALWHVPLYFLPGTGQYETGLFTSNGLIFVLSCIPLSLTYLFVSERLRGRVWAAILIHFSGNAIDALLPAESSVVLIVELAINVALAASLFWSWDRERRAATAVDVPAMATRTVEA